jgi:hypothetical protein
MRAALTLMLTVSSVFLCEGCVADALIYSGSWVEPAEPLRVAPGKFSTVALEVRNKGTATWIPEEVYVSPKVVPPSWTGGALRLMRQTKPGEVAPFEGTLSPGTTGVGLSSVSWAVFIRGTAFGEVLETQVEVTCSNGTFCDGEERFANGRCVSGVKPCDDGAQCTVDVCDEQTGTCRHTPSGTCEACQGSCTADCTGRECGDDGCGGSCGVCASEALCVEFSGQCEAPVACDPLRPDCAGGCTAMEFCGTDCRCHGLTAPQPDLIVAEARLKSELLFDTVNVTEDSCAWVEQCVTGTGMRRVLRFSVEAVNQGMATLTVPSPAERPDLFSFAPCHGHYHFDGFASYALLDGGGRAVVTGRGHASCLQDTQPAISRPDVPCSRRFNCEVQGLQRGWSDLQSNTLECQWLDITGVAPGSYRLQVTLNPARALQEATLENNTTRVPVIIPGP